MKERLQKYMARCGVASRRKCEEIILQGRVTVNGITVNDITIIDDEKDVVKIDGKTIKPETEKIYIMLNKPVGVITSAKDEKNRKTVLDIVKVKERIYPVGRLDYDTSGLLILTNDGEAAYKMTHPSKEIDKVYIARVKGIPTKDEIKNFEAGLKIDDYITSPSKLKIIKSMEKESVLQIIIHEGRNRQVRKMCEKIGHPVIKLKRIRIGKLNLGDLREGEWRNLTESEIDYIKSL
ncbi:23S rRNA pseudouridine2605 synthase [Caloramator quimbayensis]|uniref:Pseudouridine synthase n=1 Tax=Caloramator quimbayensis TaxID=1147123 RepID=A0A1T4X212_9CLOT|nr:pseudouridine synthase [Caloramator quimbayensis]SKA83115.1 23S rRNA pseudouridine2605 synthase [Caloramator quimbayensis]